MRRLMIMVALVVLLVGVFAATAYARTFTCTDLPCYGTSERDTINERPAFGVPDEIFGRAGLDNINAAISPGDVDILHGQKGSDRLNTREQVPEGDPLDTVYGGEGTDTCRVNEGDEYFSCEVVYVDGELQP
jgi:opacity protein-like surface antigen